MSAGLAIGVGLIGGVGALARFLLDGSVASAVGRAFPFGTLAVNVSGSFVLGIFAGAVLSADASELLGTGLIGAFTTFSTWTFESHRLAEDGRLRLSALNFTVSLLLGVLAAWAGRGLGGAL
ncbi:MAG TPA: fluoride efflux transporter CrcB [Solirubrobacteraceae bacterium]|nr:fluoride efflux transporter CrcB [Solirubrobacteraceae bacterium]